MAMIGFPVQRINQGGSRAIPPKVGGQKVTIEYRWAQGSIMIGYRSRGPAEEVGVVAATRAASKAAADLLHATPPHPPSMSASDSGGRSNDGHVSNCECARLYETSAGLSRHDRNSQAGKRKPTSLAARIRPRSIAIGETSMHSWLAEICAQLILATRFIDKSYRVIDRARSALVLALASDAVLVRFNSLAFGGDETYQPSSSVFRSYLFPWEKKAVTAYFPQPPARVLIGGAGGG